MQSKRLFFALWPDPEIISAIKYNNEKIKQTIKGKFVDQRNWHVTLAFLGNVDGNTTACLVERANQIQCPSFEIRFNKLLYFNKPKVLYYGVDDNSTVMHLNFLVQQCKQVQDECGLKSETRDFVAHISMVRKARLPECELNIEPVLWRANEFVLVLSENNGYGSEYTVLNRWNLIT